MTENTEEAVAWRWRDKPGLWNHQGSTRNITHAEHEPLFPLSSIQTRDARIAKLEVALECIAGWADMPATEWWRRFPEQRKIMDENDNDEALVIIARQALTGEA